MNEDDIFAFVVGFRFRVDVPSAVLAGLRLYAIDICQACEYAEQTDGIIVPLSQN